MQNIEGVTSGMSGSLSATSLPNEPPVAFNSKTIGAVTSTLTPAKMSQ